jgi:hypothetical protein
MPPSRDSFRRNRVAPIDGSILAPLASGQALAPASHEQVGTSGSKRSPSLEIQRRVQDRYPFVSYLVNHNHPLPYVFRKC